ncbi:hypothetical protein Tco_0889930 [Tanacetum coccineum]
MSSGPGISRALLQSPPTGGQEQNDSRHVSTRIYYENFLAVRTNFTASRYEQRLYELHGSQIPISLQWTTMNSKEEFKRMVKVSTFDDIPVAADHGNDDDEHSSG